MSLLQSNIQAINAVRFLYLYDPAFPTPPPHPPACPACFRCPPAAAPLFLMKGFFMRLQLSLMMIHLSESGVYEQEHTGGGALTTIVFALPNSDHIHGDNIWLAWTQICQILKLKFFDSAGLHPNSLSDNRLTVSAVSYLRCEPFLIY